MQGLTTFLEDNSIYIVMIVVLVIWFGIFLFICKTEKKLEKIEKELEEQENEK